MRDSVAKIHQIHRFIENMETDKNFKTLDFVLNLLHELENMGFHLSFRYNTDNKEYYTSDNQFYLTKDPDNKCSFVVDAYREDMSSRIKFVNSKADIKEAAWLTFDKTIGDKSIIEKLGTPFDAAIWICGYFKGQGSNA